jgi:predicted DNA-binding protein (UPF0278 family)
MMANRQRKQSGRRQTDRKLDIANDQHENIFELIEECKNSQEIDKKIQVLYRINAMLPEKHQLKIPSLITNDYISLALYRIEEKLLVV